MQLNRYSKYWLAAVAGLLLAGSTSPALADPDNSQSTFQAKSVFVMGSPGNLVPGAAILVRDNKGISYSVHTEGLAPGATTIWTVIFNNPENCANGPGRCAGLDLLNPDVNGTIVFGGADIVGADGIANLHGSVPTGKHPEGIQVNIPLGLGNGLTNASKAEVHLIIRGHGPVIPGQAVDQLTTFEPGTSPGDQQAVIFPPPAYDD